MRIDTAGNIGIGESSPACKLTVAGTISAGGDIMTDSISATKQDPNYFAGKVGIGTTGPQHGLHLADDCKLAIGTGSDIQIYHNASNSFIDDTGTGSLFIRGSQINFNKYTGETMAQFVADGSVSLNHDNVKKIETTATGVTVAGGVSAINGLSAQGGSNPVVFGQCDHGVDVTFYGDTASLSANWDASDNRFELEDNVKIQFGSEGDLEIVHDGADSCIINNNRCLYIIANDTDSDIKFMADNGSGVETEYFRVDGGYGGICYFKGTLHADGVQASYGTGNDMQIQHNGADGFINNSTGTLRICGNTRTSIVGALSVGVGDIGLDYGRAVCWESCANLMHYYNFYLCNNTGDINFDQNVTNGDIIFCGRPGGVSKQIFACMDMSAETFEVKGAVKKTVDINAQTGTTYTLTLADQSRLVTSSNASAQTITVPPNSSVAFPTGSEVTIAQYGAGQVTIAAGSGVTLYAADSELKTRVQYSTAILTKIATDTWLVAGDLTA